MNSKILLLSFLSLFLFSCSSDVESGSEQQNPVGVKLANTINLNGILLEYSYNEDQTVKILDIGTNTMNFYYSENRISSVEYLNDEYSFQYDANGKITSFTFNDLEVDVTYNAAANSYSYEKEEGKQLTLKLTENEDIKEYSILDTQTEELSKYEYFYDNSKKGVLTNSNPIAVSLVMITGFYDIGLYTSKRPVLTFSDSVTAFSFENTYDDDKFVTKSVINGTNTVYYAYNQ